MESLQEWFVALVVAVGTIFSPPIVRSFLARTGGRNGNLSLLKKLAPSISALIYPIGFKLFVDAAPLSAKLSARLDDAAYVVGVLIVLKIIRDCSLIAIEWSSARAANNKTLQLGFIPMMRNVITLFILFAGAIMILKHFNYDVMSLLAALGVGSLAVGLAAKDTLSNMISGFTLIIDRNLRPGDRVNLGGAVGDVEEIGLRSTRIRTGDGNTLIVPNSDMVNTKILNLSMPSREVTASTSFHVAYGVPFARVKELALEAARGVPQVTQARGVWANLSGIGEGYQTVSVGFWIGEMDDHGAAVSELNSRLLSVLGAAGIPPVGPASTAPANR